MIEAAVVDASDAVKRVLVKRALLMGHPIYDCRFRASACRRAAPCHS